MAEVLAHRYVEVDVDEITPHPQNPRRGNLEVIAESIETNGFFGAIVVHEATKHILVGNHRWQAAKDAGLRSLPALVVDCDEATATRILLADNRTAEFATWAHDDLIALLQDLAGTDGGLIGSGFDDAELARLVSFWARPGDPDEVPEPPAVARTKPGDLWILGGHRLLCGDSTSADDLARLMAGETARLLATDPPYLVDYDGSNHPQAVANKSMTKNKQWDSYKDPSNDDFFGRFLAACLPHVAHDAPIYQWHADARRTLVEIAWIEHGLFVHQCVIWAKNNPILTRSHFMWQTESCLYGWRKGHQPPKGRRPPVNAPNLWTIDGIGHANSRHPTEKPVKLFTDPLTWHLRQGDIALEPFSGSGTQIAAAEVTGRRCFAMEQQPVYVDVACLRWQQLTGERPVLERTGKAVDFAR